MPMDTSQQSNLVQGSSTPRISTIGEDLVITGNVTSKGEIQLDGQLQGDIHCVSLVLGESSRLEGGVIAEDVVIRGRLIGTVRALRVTLQSKCHVEGDLQPFYFLEFLRASRPRSPLPQQKAFRERGGLKLISPRTFQKGKRGGGVI